MRAINPGVSCGVSFVRNAVVATVAVLLVLSGCGGGAGKKEGARAVARGEERDPVELLHKSNREMFAMLGTPDFNRREGLTEHWQYRGDSCTLDMYFVDESGAESAGRVRAVQHFELRPSSSDARMDKAALRRCYARLVAERGKSAKGNT